MTNILTPAEASAVLRDVPVGDTEMLNLLPLVDEYIKGATGRDWTADSPIEDNAKSAARMLLVMWHENPAQIGTVNVLNFGLNAVLAQLEAEALKHRKYQFDGGGSSGFLYLEEAREGDQVESLVGIWGVSGDQTGSFESVISQDYYIQQTSGSDLSENGYLVTLISARDAVE